MVGLYNKWSAFHLIRKILVEGVLKCLLFTLGYRGLMSTVEKGADGYNVKPYVSTWNLKELVFLFKNSEMSIEKTAIRQLKPDHFGTEKVGKIFLKLFPFIKTRYGWYAVVIAKKPDYSNHT